MGKRRFKDIRSAREQLGPALEQGQGDSKYAQKVQSGRQLYGGRGADSCCAHRVKSIFLKEKS